MPPRARARPFPARSSARRATTSPPGRARRRDRARTTWRSAACSPRAASRARPVPRWRSSPRRNASAGSRSPRSAASRPTTRPASSPRAPTCSLSSPPSSRRTTSAQRRTRSRNFSRRRNDTMYETSRALFERSRDLIPGGVNSPVRAFGAVGGTPVFFREGRGARVRDEDGREYIDYVGSWGPLILGHAHPDVVAAVAQAAARGLSFGAPTAPELEMAELITSSLPSVEQVRLVSSGTEAVMSALRLARGFTGRSIIVKFEGCYPGHSDFLLVKAGSGALTFGNPTSAGVPPELTAHTLVLG